MADPTRLIDEEGADALGSELLRAARREGMPPGEHGRVWASVAAAALVAPATTAVASVATTSGAAAVAGTAKAGGVALLAKVTVAAVVLGTASVAGYRATRPAPPVAAPARAAVAPAAAPAPSEPLLPEAPAPVTHAQPAPSRGPRTAAPARSLPASRLAAEAALVVEARRALRAGDAGRALSQLEGARAELAGGALVQEREALTIEALSRLGRGPAAAARADAFLRAYPRSPHASAVRAFATP
jgi:hypothetical protein